MDRGDRRLAVLGRRRRTRSRRRPRARRGSARPARRPRWPGSATPMYVSIVMSWPEVGRRVDDLHRDRVPRWPVVAGDRQDRRADRLGTVAHQVVPVVAERRARGSGVRPAAARAAEAAARARRPRPASSSAAATSATTGAVDGRQRRRAGRSANIARTLASSACGRVDGTTLPACVSTTVARAARSWSASQVAGSKAARSARNAAIERMHLGRLVEAAQELVDVHAGGRLERLPAAVDEHEPGAALAERRRRPGRDDRPEPVAGEDDPVAGARRAARSPRRPRRRPRRASAGRSRLGRGVRQAVAAQVHRDDATDAPRSRRATGAQTRPCCDRPWIEQDARAVRRVRPAPVEEVDPVARLDDDHEALRLGSPDPAAARRSIAPRIRAPWPSAAAVPAPRPSRAQPPPPVRGARRARARRRSRCRSRPPSTRSPSSSPTSRPTSSGARTSSDRTRRCTACTRACRGPNGAPTGSPIPNRITLFRLPLEEDFADPDDLADEVWVTVIHELAHHLGIDDDRLHELGVD